MFEKFWKMYWISTLDLSIPRKPTTCQAKYLTSAKFLT